MMRCGAGPGAGPRCTWTACTGSTATPTCPRAAAASRWLLPEASCHPCQPTPQAVMRRMFSVREWVCTANGLTVMRRAACKRPLPVPLRRARYRPYIVRMTITLSPP